MPCMILDISGEITPEKNEEMEPKQKQYPAVDVTGRCDWKVKSDTFKSNIT